MPMNLSNDVLDMMDPNEFGTTVTYTPVVGSPSSVNVILDFGVNRIGYDSDIAITHDEVTFRDADIVTPKRGDTVAHGALTYTFVSELDSDSIVSTWLLK